MAAGTASALESNPRLRIFITISSSISKDSAPELLGAWATGQENAGSQTRLRQAPRGEDHNESGKRQGYDFTPAEALEFRRNFIRELSDSELDSVAGGAGDPTTESLTMAGSLVGGRVAPGGGFIGAGVGAGVGTAIGGGSTEDSVLAGAQATSDSIDSFKSVINTIFSGW